MGVSDVLGLGAGRAPQSMSLLDEVGKGLPVSALDRLAKAVAPGDSAFPFRIVARATLARRRKTAARLSPEESARVTRLASVWTLALEVWKDEEAARNFLFRPHMVLSMRRPIDVVLANELGGPMVEGILGRLMYGTGV